MNYKLGKKNKLKKKNEINKLFKTGKSYKISFLRIIFTKLNNPDKDFNFKCGVIVSKKNIKKSVNRNKIKRILRESIRLNRKIIQNQKNMIFMLIFESKKIKNFKEIQIKYLKILKKIIP